MDIPQEILDFFNFKSLRIIRATMGGSVLSIDFESMIQNTEPRIIQKVFDEAVFGGWRLTGRIELVVNTLIFSEKSTEGLRFSGFRVEFVKIN